MKFQSTDRYIATDELRLAVNAAQTLQRPLLTNYHRALTEAGLSGYTLDDLQADWRACACIAGFAAIEWGSDPATLHDMQWLWERQLARALAFLDDCDAARPL